MPRPSASVALAQLCRLPPSGDRRGPLLLACLVVAALSAIFIVSCVDLFDSFQSKAGSGQPGGGALAGSGGGLQLPYTALPKPLSVIQMAGGAGADGSA